MNLETFKRVIKLGFTNFYRNGWLSFVTSLVMSLSLIIIATFAIFNLVINVTSDNIKQKIDVSVFFYDSVKDEQIDLIKKNLEKRSDVSNVEFITKEKALEIWQEISVDEKIKDSITAEDNPLPRSLEVRSNDPENLEDIANFLNRDEYSEMIRKITYQEDKDIIQRLNSIIKFSRKLGIGLSLVFVVISILVILNTIKLNIITRSTEIEIMRLVGANNLFIRVPFFVEGVLYGILASIISMSIIGFGLNLVTPFVNNYLGDVSINLSSYFSQNFIIIMLLLLITSIMISVICGFISIQRYLRK